MRLVAILLFSILVFSCNAWKQSLVEYGDVNDAVENAILDFSNSKKLFTQDSVFLISIENPLYSMKLITLDDQNMEWVPDQEYGDIIGISIIGHGGPIYHKDEIKIGSTGIIPSKQVIVDGKLFYWYDDNYPISEETIKILNQYNLLKKIDSIADVEFVIDDGKKGADYFICRNNLTIYKKEINISAIGYYKIPKLNCNQ